MAQRVAILFGILAFALAGASVVALYMTDSGLREAARNATAPAIGGPFALVDHRGRPVTEADYRGKLMVVYFGYTFCPDVCPTGLYKIAQALDDLGEDASEVEPLFITVDPERVTVSTLADYVGNFHPNLVGLTGSPAQVKAAADVYGVYFAKAIPEDGAGAGYEYLIDHTALIFVMGRDGRFLRALSHATSDEELTAAIRSHL